MPRPEKVQAVAEIKERIEGARAVFLAEYAGLSVKEQQDLRRELRANGAEFKVVKMTLARRAADDLDIDSLDELLLGPTGLTFADDDPVGAAKVLKNFSRDHDVFIVKGGLLGLEFLTPEKISELADIEPRDVLLAKLAGAMKAPMANLAGLLAALPRNTASVLQQLLEKKEAAEPTADDDQPSTEDAAPVDAAPSDDGEAEAPAGEEEADTASDEAEGSETETADSATDESETDSSEAPESRSADADTDDASADAEVVEADASADEDEPVSDDTDADADASGDEEE